ncbi:MAG: MoaD/ThiS family protein [Dehalococcoidia bacterium]|nr:MoaD/ThiS family protein [Dehalococcoidia bacterium]
MTVTINVASYLQPHVDNKESVSVRGKTIRECLDNLVTRYPGLKTMLFDKDGKLQDFVSVFAGGQIAYGNELDQPVKDGDTLHVLYIIGGG